jgi:anti-sigma regulatory factor (Ser/Thr protein kinase)
MEESVMQVKSMPITRQADIIAARRSAKELAREFGFDEIGQEEICLAVSELASNLIKHATKGVISLKTVVDRDLRGIIVISEDDGPGFNFEKALQDGLSTAGTLGCGLGAVHRLMDELHYFSKHPTGSGSQMVCKKWQKPRPSAAKTAACPLDIGVVTRPKLGQELNGDLFIVRHERETTLFSVIDGVGHGASAHKAAHTARQYIETHRGLPLKELFSGTDRACRNTNGVVMALALIDWTQMKLTFASIGNIEAKIVNNDAKFDLIVRRGIVGRSAPAPVVSEGYWQSGMGLVLHSDGISSRWTWDAFAHHAGRSAQFIAEYMFRTLQKDHDDATLLVAK